MRRYVLALDPGQTTGVALYDAYELPITAPAVGTSFWSAEYDFRSVCQLIRIWTTKLQFDLDVVSEPYKIDKAQAPWSLEVIGVARYFSQEQTGQDLITKYGRSPGFCTDERLKALGWYRPGKRNANSATRQLLIHLVANGWWDDRLGPKIEQEVNSFSV